MGQIKKDTTLSFLVQMAPVVVVAGAFFASLAWLKGLDDTVVWIITTAAATVVFSYSMFIGFRALAKERGM